MTHPEPEALYRRLARHLDDLPGGYPSTESGVELRILGRLFTPDEAALAVHLTPLLEPVDPIARRARLPRLQAAEALERMARKGLIYRLRRDSETLYSANQFIIGIWEFQVENLSTELIRDVDEYLPSLFRAEDWRKGPQLRTIPIGESVLLDRGVLPYEDAQRIVRAHHRIVVAPCICRREHRMMGGGCDKPLETCLILGATADYYADNGLGRRIAVEEALGILEVAQTTGLVLQPGSSQRPGNICCCCGCCCQVLKAFKRHPSPASIVCSPFAVSPKPEECIGCGVCLDRCQMGALTMAEDRVVANMSRCIGCGLCVTACPTDCLRLQRKPAHVAPKVPRNSIAAGARLAVARRRTLPLAGKIVRALLSHVGW